MQVSFSSVTLKTLLFSYLPNFGSLSLSSPSSFFFLFAVLISFVCVHVFESGGPFRKWVCVDSLESVARCRAGTREEVE